MYGQVRNVFCPQNPVLCKKKEKKKKCEKPLKNNNFLFPPEKSRFQKKVCALVFNLVMMPILIVWMGRLTTKV